MKLYTCCFAITPINDPKPCVLLIRKAKPDWQRGLLNGIGGKVEQEETVIQATKREFYEETGLRDLSFEPIVYHSMLWQNYKTHTGWPLVYFSAFPLFYEAMAEAVSNTMGHDEPCVIKPLYKPFQQSELMSNLPFLIEMARCLVMCSAEERALRQPVIFPPNIYSRLIYNGWEDIT